MRHVGQVGEIGGQPGGRSVARALDQPDPGVIRRDAPRHAKVFWLHSTVMDALLSMTQRFMSYDYVFFGEGRVMLADHRGPTTESDGWCGSAMVVRRGLPSFRIFVVVVVVAEILVHVFHVRSLRTRGVK